VRARLRPRGPNPARFIFVLCHRTNLLAFLPPARDIEGVSSDAPERGARAARTRIQSESELS
jgi:hypothetical protein